MRSIPAGGVPAGDLGVVVVGTTRSYNTVHDLAGRRPIPACSPSWCT